MTFAEQKKYKLCLLTLFMVVSFYTSLFADTAGKEDSDTSIKTFRDSFIIRPFLLYPSLELIISDGSGGNKINYKPNTKMNIGADVSWKGWGVSYSTGIIPIQKKSTYGETDYLDFQMYYYFNKLNIDVFYQNYKGFYLSDNNEKKRGIRSDLEMMNAGINLMYAVSDDYSFRSSFTQTERQMTSGGSVVFMASLNFMNIDSGYSLITPEKESTYAGNAGYRGGSYRSFTLLGGYSYTRIFKDKWYLTLSALLGEGGMHQVNTVSSGEKSSDTFCSRYHHRFGGGYNDDSFFAGFLTVIDLHSTEPFMGLHINNKGNIALTRMSVYAVGFGGVRF